MSMTTEVVFNLAWIGAVIGFFLPLVISFVKNASMSTQVKRVLALVISAIAGIVSTGIQAQWSFASPGEFAQLTLFSITDIYVLSAVIYRNFWEGTSIEVALEGAMSGEGGA